MDWSNVVGIMVAEAIVVRERCVDFGEDKIVERSGFSLGSMY